MYYNKLTLIGLNILFLGGCITNAEQNPHNDVLIFGTSTKVALDVSAAVQNAGIPEFTLGYKRLEAVWMPLKQQGSGVSNESISDVVVKLNDCDEELKSNSGISDHSERARICFSRHLPANKYVSMSSGIESEKGGSRVEIDSYSVFASLGAKGSVGATNTTGSIAQFFATGIAAQRLGANPQIGLALNTEAATAAAKKSEADEKKEEAKVEKSKEVQALLDAGASPDKAAAISAGTKAAISKRAKEIIEARSCVTAWKGNAPGTLSDNNAKAIINSYAGHQNIEYLESDLDDDIARAAIISECKN